MGVLELRRDGVGACDDGEGDGEEEGVVGGVDAVEEEVRAGVVLLGGEDAARREEGVAADCVAVGGDGGRCELPEGRREDGAVVEDVDEAAVGKEGEEAGRPRKEAGEAGDEAGEADDGDGRRVEAEVDVQVEREEERREEGGSVAREAGARGRRGGRLRCRRVRRGTP